LLIRVWYRLKLTRALRIYWRVLTTPGRVLLLGQLVLMLIRLWPSPPIPGFAVETQAFRFSAHQAADEAWIETLLLLMFLLQWCAWSEQLYCVRRAFQEPQTIGNRPWRRFALHLYGGFMFLAVLSGLATIHPLLGVGAMFLLFISAEAQDQQLAQKPMAVVLIQAAIGSYRLVTHQPLRFLGRLLLPGIVLYGGAVLISWAMAELDQIGWNETGPILPILPVLICFLLAIPWLLFFLLAQLRIAWRSQAELDVDVLMKEETAQQPQPASWLRHPIQPLLLRFAWLCRGLAALFAVLGGGWLLFNLSDAGLLSGQALFLAFSASFSLVSSTLSGLLSLIAKLAFMAMVLAGLIFVVTLLVGLGRADPLKSFRQLASGLQARLKQLIDSLPTDLIKPETLGLGALLSVLATVGLQTFERIQKDMERQANTLQEIQIQQNRQAEEARKKMESNEALVARIQSRVNELVKEKKGSETETPALKAIKVQLLSELRDTLPQLTTATGQVDGERKGRILRYLYEAGLLKASTPPPPPPGDPKADKSKASNPTPTPCDPKADKSKASNLTPTPCDPNKDCDWRNKLNILSPDNRGLTAQEVEVSLKTAIQTELFLHEMDFKGAKLENAYLPGAFLPYIDLSYANLRNANLTGAVLGSAKLMDADLTGATITAVFLEHAVLVGTNMTDVKVDEKVDEKGITFQGCKMRAWPKLSGAEAFYATYVASEGNKQKLAPMLSEIVSWDAVKGQQPGIFNERWTQWTFCPLDPDNEKRLESRYGQNNAKWPFLSQAGSKCRNRRFDPGQADRGRLFERRDWSGSLFNGSTLSGIELNSINLAGADLSNTTFSDVELKNVSFVGANLKGAVFRDSILDEVDFSGADLRGIQFERMQRQRRLRYNGSIVDTDKNASFSAYGRNVMRSQVYPEKLFSAPADDEVSVFRRTVLAPLLRSPFTFRPQQLLYWMLAYPQPRVIVSHPSAKS